MKFGDLPRTAAEARALGLKHFYDGRPCRHGHDSPRYSNRAGGCVACTKAKNVARDEPPVCRPAVVLRRDWRVDVIGGTVAELVKLSAAEQRMEHDL